MLSAVLTFCGLQRRWPQLSEEQVQLHNSRHSLWIVSGTAVYDVTDIIYSHPGGDLALLRRGGGSRDCAKDMQFHSRYARRQWEARKVGELAAPVEGGLTPSHSRSPCGSSDAIDGGECAAAVAAAAAAAETRRPKLACSVVLSPYTTPTGAGAEDAKEGGVVVAGAARRGSRGAHGQPSCQCPRCATLAQQH